MAVAKPVILDPRARAVRIIERMLVVSLADGRELRVPVEWFPRLAAGSPSQQANYRVIEGGRAINWPDLDEDIGIKPLLATTV